MRTQYIDQGIVDFLSGHINHIKTKISNRESSLTEESIDNSFQKYLNESADALSYSFQGNLVNLQDRLTNFVRFTLDELNANYYSDIQNVVEEIFIQAKVNGFFISPHIDFNQLTDTVV